MHELYEVFEKLCMELEEVGQKELTMDNLKLVDTLAHAAKNVLKIVDSEDGSSYHGSYRGSYDGGSYRMSHKRDSMGRYSREGSSNEGSYDGMTSREGLSRYSRAGSNNVTDGLRELMYAAPPEMQGEINRLIKKLDNM